MAWWWIRSACGAIDSLFSASVISGTGSTPVSAILPAKTETQAGAPVHAAEVVVRHAGTLAAWAWLRGLVQGTLQGWRTRRELEALPDRMLQDIGLRRDQIDGLGGSYSRMPRCNDSIW